MRKTLIFCLATSSLLVACIAREPNDLQITDIEKMTSLQARVEPSRPTQYGSADVLKLDVATSTDLRRLANGYGSEIRFSVTFCGWIGRGPRPFIIYPNELSGTKGTIGGFKDSRGVFHYIIFVYISDNGLTYGNGSPYDLDRQPHDICISTRGGNETGFGYKSNKAVAYKAQISSILTKN